MEIRRVQVTGGSSYMVTLPKAWADSVGICKNDPVGLQPQPDGSLVIYPRGVSTSRDGSVSTVRADDAVDTEFLYRQLVGAYISGMDAIEVVSQDVLSNRTVSAASRFAHIAIGMEITEETEDRIVIEDLIDHRDIRPYRSVERMRVLTRNMIGDLLKALKTGSAEPLEGMEARDTEVDRLDWLISRQISILQGNIVLSREMGVDLREITSCGNVSRCIERIGDHAVMAASEAGALLEEGAPGSREGLADAGREAMELFSDSVSIWLEKDMVRADGCIRRCQELVRGTGSVGDAESVAARTVVGSIRRIAEYSMDISENTINNAMSRRTERSPVIRTSRRCTCRSSPASDSRTRMPCLRTRPSSP